LDPSSFSIRCWHISVCVGAGGLEQNKEGVIGPAQLEPQPLDLGRRGQGRLFELQTNKRRLDGRRLFISWLKFLLICSALTRSM
jgi:hypothetical protein